MREKGMVATIFSSPLSQTVLVFVLVFVGVFAVLQKSKIFGEGKRQIDALIALALALIAASAGYATDFIGRLVPFLAVALVILMVFLILYGAVHQGEDFKLPKGVTYTLGGVIVLAVAIAVLYFTPAWAYILEAVSGGSEGSDSAVLMNVVFVVVVIAVVIGVLTSGKKGSGEKKS